MKPKAKLTVTQHQDNITWDPAMRIYYKVVKLKNTTAYRIDELLSKKTIDDILFMGIEVDIVRAK